MLGDLGAGSVRLGARAQGLQRFAGEVDPQGQRLQHRRVARPVLVAVRETLGGMNLGVSWGLRLTRRAWEKGAV